MRLTLRTLLAYMDDILDPSDHEELGKKIEASEFAAELIHRSRDTVRRLRLGAPEVLAGEDDDVLNPDPASDANAVAEYLDNTLPPEHVAEFERVCLDTGTVADMHLAEVTSCHHVLTMVLGEPAEIDPQVRQRMYELPQTLQVGDKLRIEPAHPSDAAPVAEAAAAPLQSAAASLAAVAPASAAEELPDYLRVAADRRRRGQRWATAAALALLGGFSVYLLSGSFVEPETPPFIADAEPEQIRDLTELQIGTEPVETAPEEPSLLSDEASGSNVAPRFVPEDAAVSTPEAQPPLVAEPEVEPPAAPLALAEGATPATEPESTPETSLVAPEWPTSTESALASTDTVTPPRVDLPLPPQDTAAPEPLKPEEQPPILDPNELIASATTKVMPEDSLHIDADDDEEEVPAAPQGPVRLGTYRGLDDVLLRFLPETEQWLRLPSQAMIMADDTLLTLPKYRSHVVLGNVNAYLAGGTQITLPNQAATEERDDPLVIDMIYGRLILNADAGAREIKLHVNDVTYEIRLHKSASLAVEVHRLFVPGADYKKASAAVEVNWYLANGTAQWIGANGRQESLQAPSAWKSVNGADTTPESIATLPAWIEKEPVTSLERSASMTLNQQLAAGQPVELSIAELTNTTNRENRRLASEASLYVGEFEPFIKSLNDSDQRIAWRPHITAMRQAIAREPQLAVKLHKDFINVRGPEAGEDLYAMVRGFTPEQIGLTRDELRRGVLLDLLRWLENDNLDYRVLAIYNLDALKGTTELKGYRPDAIPRSRQIAVEKIRKMIEDDEFLPLPQER